MTAAGLPHSETPGSQPACGSPRTIAACRVLHRLSVPRHPPCALISLGRIFSGPTRKPAYPLSRTGAHVGNTLGAFLSYYPSPYPYCQSNQVLRSALLSASDPRRSASRAFIQAQSRSEERGPELLAALKEVIQPQVPLRLPCYDFAPVTELAFGASLSCELGQRLRALPTSMA